MKLRNTKEEPFRNRKGKRLLFLWNSNNLVVSFVTRLTHLCVPYYWWISVWIPGRFIMPSSLEVHKRHIHFYFAIHHIPSCLCLSDRNKSVISFLSSLQVERFIKWEHIRVKTFIFNENNFQAVELTIFSSNAGGQIKDR